MQYQLGVLENGDIHRMAVYLGIFGCWIVLNHVKQCETIGFRTEPSFSDATDSSLEPSPSSVDYVWLQGTWNISGWWFQPLWKIWKSVGIIIPNLWKNKNVPNHQPDIVGQPEQDSQAASRCVTLGTVGTEKWDKMGNYTQQKKQFYVYIKHQNQNAQWSQFLRLWTTAHTIDRWQACARWTPTFLGYRDFGPCIDDLPIENHICL